MELFFAVIMMCWSSGSPECYGMALIPPRPLVYCEIAAPVAEEEALKQEPVLRRIEKWGEPTSVETKCMSHAEAKESLNDPRTE